MFGKIPYSILRKVVSTPEKDIRAKLIEMDISCKDPMIYTRMQKKVVQEIYAENLNLIEEHGDKVGFIGWEPEKELGETYENVKSTWGNMAKYFDEDENAWNPDLQ
jgi:hypothetical protein